MVIKEKQIEAERDLLKLENEFISWVHTIRPEALEFNPGSVQQLQQLIFAPCYRNISENKVKIPSMRTVDKSDKSSEEGNDIENDENNNKNNNKSKKGILVLPEQRIFRVENKFV